MLRTRRGNTWLGRWDEEDLVRAIRAFREDGLRGQRQTQIDLRAVGIMAMAVCEIDGPLEEDKGLGMVGIRRPDPATSGIRV